MKSFEEEARKRYQNLSEIEKEKGKKRSETDIKIFLTKNKIKKCQDHRKHNVKKF